MFTYEFLKKNIKAALLKVILQNSIEQIAIFVIRISQYDFKPLLRLATGADWCAQAVRVIRREQKIS